MPELIAPLRYSLCTTLQDGTKNYAHYLGEGPARSAFRRACKNARPAVALIELRRHEHDGTLKIIHTQEGAWR